MRTSADTSVGTATDTSIDSSTDPKAKQDPESAHRTLVSAIRDDALGTHDAVALTEALANGDCSREELVTAAIERARAVNPTLNAIVHETFDRALVDARSDAHGLFGGLPSFVKDNDPIAGVPCRMGSDAFPKGPAPKSSAFVGQYLSTGLISLGKTALPELGLTATTEPLLGGPTHNPWHTNHTAGGSSGGSAAMVAAGVVPIAHANDGGGSIRIPASACGLVGLKTTRGRFIGADISPVMPVDIISQGCVTRTVRDTAAFAAAAERYKTNRKLPELGHVTRPGKSQLRIAFYMESDGGRQCDPECEQATIAAAKACEELGHHVDQMPSPFDSVLTDDFVVYWGLAPWILEKVGKLAVGRDFDASRMDAWSKRLGTEFGANLRRVPGVIRRLRQFARVYESLFTRHDVLITPTLGTPPVELGYISPDVPFEVAIQRLLPYASFTPVQNVSGAPAISLPLGRSKKGLPIGVQFASAFGQDRRLLELALALEEARPWKHLWETD